jgi:hypothetical protein
MPSYRICFINEIARGNKLFRCCQRSIVIRSARSPQRAVEAAKKRFARIEGIHDWNIHAGMIEMEEIDLSAPANRSHRRFHGPRRSLRLADARNKRRTQDAHPTS